MIGFTVLAVLIVGALCYATIEAIDGWAQAVVLAVIVLTAVGVMIALSPHGAAPAPTNAKGPASPGRGPFAKVCGPER